MRYRTNEQVPEYLRDWEIPFRFLWLDDGRLPYLQIRANRDSGGRSIREFIEGVATELKARKPKALVVDLRLTYGGDFTTTADFFLGVIDYLAADARIAALIGNVTFSAGILSVAYLEHGTPDRVVLVGERVGDRERFWSEAPGYTLPNSKMRLKYSLQLHDVKDGCDEPSICFPGELATEVAVGPLVPDVAAPLTFDNYESGRDPALEAARTLLEP